jgi:hypothetical protein
MATSYGTRKRTTRRIRPPEGKRFDLLSMEFAFLTRAQVTRILGQPRDVMDRLIATGQLTQYRTAGLGRGGQRVFYSRAQVERILGRFGGSSRRGK